MAIAYSPELITDSLAGCWDFGNKKSYDPKENLTTQSQNFSAWSTPGENIFTSAQTVAPDGTLTGWKGTNNSSANNFNFFWQQINTTVGGLYTNSVYIKNIDLPFFTMLIGVNGLNQNAVWHYDTALNSLYPVFDPGNNSVVSQSVTDVGNGWKRLSVTANATNLAANASLTIANVSPAYYLGKSGETSLSYTKSAYVWGTQFERNLTASTYVATTTTQYTRSTTLIDISGYGNNLTANGNPVWSSANGGFIRFNPTSYFSGTGNNNLPTRNSGYTLQAWIRYPTSTVVSGAGFLSIGEGSAPNARYNGLRNLSTLGSFSHWWFGNNLDVTTNVAGVVANQWYLITGVYYPFSLRRLYVNTTLVGSDSPTENHSVPQNPVVDIARATGAVFPGDIAHCSVYRTALDLGKITQNYNALKSRFNA